MTIEIPFTARHIGPSPEHVSTMLSALGWSDVDSLIDAVLPPEIRVGRSVDLPGALSEPEATAELASLAARNRVYRSFIGLGWHNSHTPGVIRRNILENPAWYTAYTPYQAEISQGRLEALLNFQTMVADLTAMDLANASMLDDATAAAEAVSMARRASKRTSDTVFVDAACHPHVIAVVETRAEAIGLAIQVGHVGDLRADEVFAAVLASPSTTGELVDLSTSIDALHAHDAIAIVHTDLLACCITTPPGEQGADIAVGSSQRFGVPLGFGGPNAGFLACRESLRRGIPGRLVGVSVDSEGRTAYRLALQTREQHIRREKATSNICTAQVLLAVIAGAYAMYHGPEGLQGIAHGVHRRATAFATGASRIGLTPSNTTWFDTVTIESVASADAVMAAALGAGFNLRRVDDDRVAVAFDETTTDSEVITLLDALATVTSATFDRAETDALLASPLDQADRRGRQARQSPILGHPIFSAHRSETEMLRYLRRLADFDIALDRSMIPLGSCTMKLNATSEMEPISWPEFASIHPFAPADQTVGYQAMIDQLCVWLCEITGYDNVSVQPNAGSQGEFAGLLAIRGYHRSRGDEDRTVCLIPSSAHGTNAASAVMVGFRVVVVACDDDGNIDRRELSDAIDRHRDQLAALMITYPSTHGVFEEGVTEICAQVHGAGGQVYLDGANMNALVGLSRPGDIGADVSHLNLHKTFCIPHGGGGPGVGPVAVKAHLAEFLPGRAPSNDTERLTLRESTVGPVAAAPFGSAGILPITWMYVRTMGADGLRRATVQAILSANYLRARLADHYPVLYSGRDGLVAHECIIDIRPLERSTGITAEDIAKRLIDFGFHAPTMSFPVAGTLMIEPTESESLAELDRFCEAMIAIRHEIAAVADGRWTADESPVRRAPHTAADCLADSWDRPYSRSVAAYPLGRPDPAKYWPPVSRIDNPFGDRNLMCSCPPPGDFADDSGE